MNYRIRNKQFLVWVDRDRDWWRVGMAAFIFSLGVGVYALIELTR